MSQQISTYCAGNMNTEVIKHRHYPEGGHFSQFSSFNNLVNSFICKVLLQLELSDFYFKDHWDLWVSVFELHSRKIPGHFGTLPFTVRTKYFKLKTIYIYWVREQNITGKTRGSFY